MSLIMKYLPLMLLFISSLAIAQNSTDSLATDSLAIKEQLMIDMPTYSLELPNTWKINAGCIETQCTAASPTDTIRGYDTYIETINLTVIKLSNAKYTAEKYATYSIGYLPKVVKEFRVIEKKKLNARSYRVTYTGVKNNLRQVWRQYYHVKNAKVHIVTFSAEQRKYRYYREMIEPYLASFKFK